MRSFFSQTDRCSRLLFSGSNGELIFVLRVFALRGVLEERIKLVIRGIPVLPYVCQPLHTSWYIGLFNIHDFSEDNSAAILGSFPAVSCIVYIIII
jgi:hypothetical protein